MWANNDQLVIDKPLVDTVIYPYLLYFLHPEFSIIARKA